VRSKRDTYVMIRRIPHTFDFKKESCVLYAVQNETESGFFFSILFTHQQIHYLLNLETNSAQHTTHMPFQDMLPHHHITYKDIILLSVLT
jgi:hypothetical protein